MAHMNRILAPVLALLMIAGCTRFKEKDGNTSTTGLTSIVCDNSFENIEKIMNDLPDDYQVIITADHGGHDRTHGTDLDEDMIIPMICHGTAFAPGTDLGTVSIKDVAPTVTALLGVKPDEEWEG